MTMRCLALVLLAALTAPPAAIAQARGSASFDVAGTSAGDVDAFLRKINEAIDQDDHAAVARMVAYPAKMWIGHRTITVKNRAELMRYYDSIFSDEVVDILAEASSKTAWANWQGVMFEDGRVWLSVGEDRRLRIATVNPPADS